MKSKLTIFLTFFLMLSLAAFSQAPNSFKYQSMVRKADGSALVNQSVKVKISILKGSTSGTSVYSEVHSTTSNAFGIVNLSIGEGSEKSGSISMIDWSVDLYFVKVEMDENGGINYTLSSVSQLLSVPYALFANTVSSIDWSKIQNKPSFDPYAKVDYVDSIFNILKSDPTGFIVDFVYTIKYYTNQYNTKVAQVDYYDASYNIPVTAHYDWYSNLAWDSNSNRITTQNGEYYLALTLTIDGKKYIRTKKIVIDKL